LTFSNLKLTPLLFACLSTQGDQSLALPHVYVNDIRSINWDEVRAAGFLGEATVF
jgi:hypothetical protein